MSYLTKEERFLLIVLCAVIMFGSTLRFCLVKFPSLKSSLYVIESANLYDKIDINKASREEFEALPYIGEITSRSIIEYRTRRGVFHSIDELKNVPGIKEKNFERFKAYLKCCGER